MPNISHQISAQSVFVVIPTYNEDPHIGSCLKALRQGDPFMRDVLIVVVDGRSTDNTRAIVQAMARADPKLVLLDNPARLQSAGINLAVAECATPEHRYPKHRYMVRCDAHARYPPDYVRQVVTSLETHPQAASVVTVMDAEGDEPFQRACAWVVDTPLGSGGSAHRGGQRAQWVDHGHHAGFRLDWFQRLGGYDPGFSHNEDAEYDQRLQHAGGRIWLDAGIRMGYKVRPTPRALLQQYWRYGRGRAKTIAKHRARPRLRQVIPVINLIGIVLSLCAAPFVPQTLIWPLFYLMVLVLVSLTAAFRLKTIGGLWAGLALGLMHMGWGAGFLWEMAAKVLKRG